MTTKSAAKSRKAPVMGATFGLTVQAEMPTAMGESAILENLLNDLEEKHETLEPADDSFNAGNDLIESCSNAALFDDDINEMELEDAVAAAEAKAAKHALYADQPAAVAGDISDTPAEPTKAEKKAAKAAAAAVAKAEKAAAKIAAKEAAEVPDAASPDESAEPKAPKVPRATSITHKPGALLMVKLGATARDYLTFSLHDAGLLEPEAMTHQQDDFIARMDKRDAIADKVKEKMTMLLCWLQKGGELNEVLKRTFTVLHDKKELTSGDKGNLQLNLLSKPYSMGTARSQSNQMFMALPELGIVVKEKGRMIANPDSVLLPMINAKLGLV